MRVRILHVAALGATVFGAAVIGTPGCTSADDPILGKYAGSSPDARNYCAIATACGLLADFGFGECINQIVRTQIELAPFGGDTGAQARYECVKAAGTSCDAAKKCFGHITGKDPRCTSPDGGAPFPGQPRSFCDGDRITVCSVMSTDSQTFACADDFIQQKFGGPTCVPNADGSALCGFAKCTTTSDGDGGVIYPAATCTGQTLSYCTNGVQQRQNCILQGGTCDATTGNCQNTCAKTGYVCLGSELDATCQDGSKLAQYDCASRPGWTCQVPQDSTT
ncbi:MAG TPA: hypothetical protein VF316_18675, partial [Polyangiaceae bacterium]